MSNTGGPAFPHVADLVQHSPNGGITTKPITSGGMTLRDYFAAKVLPRCLEFCSTNSKAAEEAYRIADAMLAAREQK